MKTKAQIVLIGITCVALGWPARAAWLDRIKSALSRTNTPVATGPLSQDEMVGGLKEALGNGVERAVGTLGRHGGFLTNLNVRIPLPEKLRPVERTLRALGQNQLVDDFVASMNHAAKRPCRPPPRFSATPSAK